MPRGRRRRIDIVLQAMSFALVESHETEAGVSLTFATEDGLQTLEGSYEEVRRFGELMRQVSALAALNDSEDVWVDQVQVGEAIVKLGLKPGGEARVRIIRPWSSRPRP